LVKFISKMAIGNQWKYQVTHPLEMNKLCETYTIITPSSLQSRFLSGMLWVLQGKWKSIFICLYIYTNLHKNKTFFIIFSTYDVSEDLFKQFVRNEWLYLHHAIVYIPTADFRQNWWKTQAKPGFLKPFAERYFLIFKQVDL